MGNENELNITVQPNADGKPQILTILHGEAVKPLALKEPLIINHTGILDTPANWIEKRKLVEGFDPLVCSVVADYKTRKLTLVIDEKNYYKTTITGVLKLHPELESLGINEQKTYDEKELYEKLKFMERFFSNKDAYQKLMTGLKEFKAKVNAAFTNINDLKGSIALQKVYDIKTGLDLDFMLNMPVFAAGVNQSFKVEINVGLDGGDVCFWLVSVNLHTSIETETENMFETELKRLADYAIVKQY